MKRTVEPGLTNYQRLGAALLVSNLVSATLFIIRVQQSQNIRYWFLLWNLLLAWVPLGIVLLLRKRLITSRLLTWPNIVLSFLWLGFLPNSFYLVSDLIHLHSTGEVSILFDAVMFMSFIFNGFVAGYASIYLMQTELLTRFRRDYVHGFVGVVLLVCSFAIYLGRDLRWNTWDILVNPAGILFDVSERVINPLTHSEVFSTTALFFVLLSSIYIVAWQFVHALRNNR
ncbi:DUF1361 domain-containing protein [Candidatus Saccharibacteria bacterium]|nr:DUF1361 domain-containing protein [Candidatus Saccharibacteria bacterium]